MKISVVLASYNGEKYIEQQLGSLLNQSRKPDEVLICDDCSTDNTQLLVRSFINNNNCYNWRLLVNAVNKGWRTNFWDGIKAATGDYIFLCDQDDIWISTKVELMSSILDNNSKIDLLASGYTKYYENTDSREALQEENDVIQQSLYNNIFNVHLPGCTYCVRKSFVERVNPYWTPDTAHDELLWRFSLFSNSLYIYRKNLILWRKHDDSAWSIQGRRAKSRKVKLDWIKFAKDQLIRLKKYLEYYDLCDKEKDEIIHGNEIWLENRYQLLTTKKINYAIKLLSKTKYYNSFKQYLGDLYITYYAK